VGKWPIKKTDSLGGGGVRTSVEMDLHLDDLLIKREKGGKGGNGCRVGGKERRSKRTLPILGETKKSTETRFTKERFLILVTWKKWVYEVGWEKNPAPIFTSKLPRGGRRQTKTGGLRYWKKRL